MLLLLLLLLLLLRGDTCRTCMNCASVLAPSLHCCAAASMPFLLSCTRFSR